MSLINRVYTAQDMRDAAKCLFACEVDLKHDNRDISRMLRQSADMMDRAERLRAALKPVLDIVMDGATSDLSMEMAITEAKRIYKEGCDELKEEAK